MKNHGASGNDLSPRPPETRTPSRRGVLTIAAGAMAAGLGRATDGAATRRNACQVRCGGDRRLCRNDCRDEGLAERPCKKACNRLRHACFIRCDYRPLHQRLFRG